MKPNKIISIILALEFIYTAYKVIPSLLLNYNPSDAITYLIVFIILLLPLISSIGTFFNKKWAIILLWIYVFSPFLLSFFQIINGFFTYVGYYSIILVTICATFLSTVVFLDKRQTGNTLK